MSKLFVFILILFISTNKISGENILSNYENQQINAISQFEDRLLAIALNNSIIIYEYKNLELIEHKKLEFSDEFNSLTEFKLVNEKRLIFCTFTICR